MKKRLQIPFIAFLVLGFVDGVFILLTTPQQFSFGKGLSYTTADSSFKLKFNFRLQNLYSVIYDETDQEFSSQFLIRRSRLKFDGYALSPNLQYKVELGISNRDMGINNEDGNTRGASRMILDAVLKWQFSKHWSLWVGQTKLPGNRERVISSSDLQFVDRSRLNSRFTLDRDAGIQLRGKYSLGKAVFAPAFAISQGEGRNITSLNYGGYDYTVHLEIFPFGAFSNKKGAFVSSDLEREQTPKLAVGLTYDYNDRAVRQGGQLGNFVMDSEFVYVENSLRTFFADLMFKYKGFSVLSEYADKRAGHRMTDVSRNFLTGAGFNLQAGYLFDRDWEVALRYTTVRRDGEFSGVRDENQYTLGLSKYMAGHNLKVQSDLTRIAFPGETEGEYMFRMQVEMQF